MSLLTASNLSKSFGVQDIFSDISFHIERADKIALIGANGTGKTTLLRILAGLEYADGNGEVHRARDTQIGYLPQLAKFPSDHTIYDEMLSVFSELRAQEAQLRQLEQQMAAAPNDDELLQKYDELHQQFEFAGGFTYEQRIKHVLMGLGFSTAEYDTPISILSGGQQTRALLSKLLLQEPDLLLLDEPTNYLDLAAMEWLETYLQSWRGSLVVVAHDRYFLDKVVNRVWELTYGRLECYRGNYSHYVQQRGERMARRRAEYERQQRYIAKTEDFIRRYMAGQRTKEAQGRLKRLERLERLEKPRNAATIKLNLDTKTRTGDMVLAIDDLEIGYSRNRLFKCDELTMWRGECIALLGANGSGKTTFIKTILRRTPPLAGEYELGYNVKMGYFSQGHVELNQSNTVLEELLTARHLLLKDARNFLGRFLFRGDDVFKPVNTLSGGERARLALAKLALQDSNLLLLDEPTNHLDIPSQEILEEVLRDFSGSMLLVSHDRYLVRALANKLWFIEDGAVTEFAGTYDEYLEKRAAKSANQPSDKPANERESKSTARAAPREKGELTPWARARRIEELEHEIEGAEVHLNYLRGALERASAAQDVAELQKLGTEYSETETTLDDLLKEWTEIHE